MTDTEAKKRFKPSSESLSAADRSKAMLDYLDAATEAIREHIEATGEPPPVWALDRIQIAAANIGMAVTFMRKRRAK
jgi:hypothetical protein